MRIDRIIVSGLFDRFNHDLVFKPDERITIMIGPNGFGKTMILRIVNALFNQPLRTLARMPFEEVAVCFDDKSHLSVARKPSNAQSRDAESELKLSYQNPDSTIADSFQPSKIDPRELPFPVGAIDEFVPFLDQVGPAEWRHRMTAETLELEDVLERFSDELPRGESLLTPTTPDWLKRIRTAIPVRFIDTERLTHPLPARRPAYWSHPPEGSLRIQRTVRRYSDELAERVKKTLSDYGSRAQALDRTFPVRLVDEPPKPDYTMTSLRRELDEVEAKRARLVEAGLLAQELEGWEVPSLEKVDEARRGVLAVYARDAREKLSIFDDLYARIDVLKRIANSRFLHKRVSVGPDGLGVFSSDGSKLELEMLSSGEQHELVILYELLFRVPNNAFILFDEPELSLHVAWQEKFLDDLEDMAKISKFRVLLATHSPQIIGDRWDLTVELRGPNDQ